MSKEMKHTLLGILYNVFAHTLIFTIGVKFFISFHNALIVYLCFAIPRILIESLKLGSAMHYHTSKWYMCLIWSIVIISTFYIQAKSSLTLSITLAIFMSLVLTTAGDLKNGIMYKKFNYGNLTRKEIDFYLNECNFTPDEEEYFKYRTVMHKSQIETYMSMYISESKATRLSNSVLEKINKVH